MAINGRIFQMHVTAAIKAPLYFCFSSITSSRFHQAHWLFPPLSLLFCCYVRSLNNIRVLREANFVAPFVPLHSDMPKPPGEDVFILPDEYKFIPRNKRAVLMKNKHNQRLNVEMLVVVDRQMMDNHGHENITTYVLTVLNMVRDGASLMQASCCSSRHEFPGIKL